MKTTIYILLLLLSFPLIAQVEIKYKKDSTLVPKSIMLQELLNSIEGCNFANWSNPLKGSSITYPAPLNGNGYDGTATTQWNCISTRANQTWFYVNVLTGGNLKFRFTNSNNVDVDGIIWGPVANGNLGNSCLATQNTPLSCDYSVSPVVELPCTTHTDLCGGTQTSGISASAGQVYIICILNYANSPTNITLTQPTGGSVFYSQELNNGLAEHFSVKNNSRIRLQSNKENGVFKVCADGTNSSIFKLTGYSTNNLRINVLQDPNNSNEPIYGKFLSSTPINGGIETIYKHPTHMSENAPFKLINIQVIDISTSNVLATFPVRIYRTPVIMVHGLNSEGSSFNKMYNSLLNSQLYNKDQLSKLDYKSTNKEAFAINSAVVPNGIYSILVNLQNKGYSVQKVDLVGHSMGGILSRLYLQSPIYSEDINKLITICTPHSGAPIADRLRDPNFADGNPVACWFVSCSGAINDLRVGTSAQNSTIDTQLNGERLNYKKVPTHAIATTQELINGSSTMTTAWNYMDTTPIALYNEASDLIVPISSQLGGLTGCVRTRANQEHAGAQDNITIISDVQALLGDNPNGGNFCLNGYDPTNLTYTPLLPQNNLILNNLINPVVISSPSINNNVNIGGQLIFTASSNQALSLNLYIKLNEKDIFNQQFAGSSFSQSLVIDNSYTVGQHEVLVVADFGNNNTSYSTTSFNVSNCTTSYNLTGEILNPFYQVTNTIQANGLIPFGYKVEFQANKSITLTPGFETDNFSILNIKLGGCN